MWLLLTSQCCVPPISFTAAKLADKTFNLLAEFCDVIENLSLKYHKMENFDSANNLPLNPFREEIVLIQFYWLKHLFIFRELIIPLVNLGEGLILHRAIAFMNSFERNSFSSQMFWSWATKNEEECSRRSPEATKNVEATQNVEALNVPIVLWGQWSSVYFEKG